MENHKKLRDFLSNKDVWLDDEELDVLFGICVNEERHKANKGYHHDRTKDYPREQAFAAQWMKDNEPNSRINNGHGVLQDLFILTKNPFSIVSDNRVVEVMTSRDRMIVATVVQWLGSNNGMSFLHESLSRFGARIVFKDNKDENR